MRKNKILSVIGGLAAFIFTSCDGIFDVDYYTFLSEDYIFTNESTIEEGLLGCYELLYPNSFGGSSWGVRPHMMLANLPTLDVQASDNVKLTVLNSCSTLTPDCTTNVFRLSLNSSVTCISEIHKERLV